MATPKINENCHYMQNDSHKCKIKLKKFHFDILCRFGVIKESLPGGWNPPPPQGEIGLTYRCYDWLLNGVHVYQKKFMTQPVQLQKYMQLMNTLSQNVGRCHMIHNSLERFHSRKIDIYNFKSNVTNNEIINCVFS